MKALLKIEWIKTWRSWPVFIMGIGMPVGFFLLFSSIVSTPNPEAQKDFLLSYMLTMTGFSMSSFGLFTFPYMLQEDQTEHWLTYIEHSKISISAYYLSKIFRVLLNFMVAIIVTFCVGAFVRDVELPLSGWLGSGALLLLSSLVFLAFGLLIAQIKSQQIMSVVANITYLGLAIVGGSWMPISMFPKWVQSISEWTPVYHVNELVVNFAINGEFSWKSVLFILAYTVVATGLALFIKSQRESDRG
ncbi:ABC transporter permease [Streptococcus thermophilus]|nr:ABC transporter permease [Streptococcus thermophilus]MCE2094054.1 ABC transporter permease [Streptococcus thermophilus]MCE2098551.1 ABC transporter permease [Streptococcus thermophilus]MCE2198999.1 ABC transporter permease [Streptococcus thermophilus]MCE2200149.1 ABC transporter permease [Streptococcus thermophilus]